MAITVEDIQIVIAAKPELIKDPAGLQLTAEMLWEARWGELHYDMNGDGIFTISDVAGWIKWAINLPGDMALIEAMRYFPKTAQFLEIGPSTIGAWQATLMSTVSWLFLGLIVLAIYEAAKTNKRAS